MNIYIYKYGYIYIYKYDELGSPTILCNLSTTEEAQGQKGTSTKSCGYASLLKNRQETIDGNGWTDWLQTDLGRTCGL